MAPCFWSIAISVLKYFLPPLRLLTVKVSISLDRHTPNKVDQERDFFPAPQHPSAFSALTKLAEEYSMPARVWKHGIQTFLGFLGLRFLFFFGSYVGFCLYCVFDDRLMPLRLYRVSYRRASFFRVVDLTCTSQCGDTELWQCIIMTHSNGDNTALLVACSFYLGPRSRYTQSSLCATSRGFLLSRMRVRCFKQTSKFYLNSGENDISIYYILLQNVTQ